MSCNYQETDVSKISKDILECKASGDRIAKLADQIRDTILLNEKNKAEYNKQIYMWNRAESQHISNISAITDRIKKIEAEKQADWGTRCGVLGQYDYHCQLGNFLNQELYPQLAVHQKKYSDFLTTFPKPTYTSLPVPNFENTMICQACTQCVNQSGNVAGGDIVSSLSQVNNCTINLEKKLKEVKAQPKTPIFQNPQPPQIINPKPLPTVPPPETTQEVKNNTGLIILIFFIAILLIALGTGYYFYEDIFGSFEKETTPFSE